jgi:hypothetical protein
MKKKIGEIYNKPIVVGNKNEVTKNEIHVGELVASGESGSGESGSKELERNDINFFDYDGTLLYAYTWEEAKNLTELPPLPTHENLEVREWNYTLEDIKAQGTETTIGKADIGACCYNENGEQVMTNGTYIIERGITSIDYETLNPDSCALMAKVMSIPATINYVSTSALNYFIIEHLRMPINIEYEFYYGKAFHPRVIRSFWVNGCDLNTNIIDGILGLNITHIPHTFSTFQQDDSRFRDSFITYVPETIHTMEPFRSSEDIKVFVFDKHKFVPTLTSFSNFSAVGAIFIVPDALYDEWISSTNWSLVFNGGGAWAIKKLSEYSYLIK